MMVRGEAVGGSGGVITLGGHTVNFSLKVSGTKSTSSDHTESSQIKNN